MKINGYVGICRSCFDPIQEGEEIKFREQGSFFHRQCVEANPNNYYIALERIRGQFEQGKNAVDLMNNLEQIFKIPALDDKAYQAENKEVIELYKEISSSRFKNPVAQN